jgi:two-component system, cell cycle sensor histidine kinase and response regulator CckA
MPRYGRTLRPVGQPPEQKRVENSSDTEQLQRLREHLRVVSEAAKAFAEATTDYERLLDSVARILSERVQDACAVFLAGDDAGSPLRSVSLHASDPQVLVRMQEMFELDPLAPARNPTLRAVLESGDALLVPHIEQGPAPAQTLSQGEAQRRLGLHSYLVVALRAHERSIGVLALGRFRPDSPAFNAHDLELAQNLADHASLAIQNARLYSAVQEAEQAAVHAEERVRKGEQTHRFFFESSPIPTFVFDTDSERILAANVAALALYGYDADEFLRLFVDDLRVPEERNALSAAMKAAGESASLGVGHHRKKDGGIIFVEGRHHQISFEGQKARFVVVTDLTERVKAEAARRESEALLQRTLDMMMEGYTVLGPDLRYVFVNDVGARHAQLPREKMIGNSPMELYPNFESTGMYGLLTRCLRERVPVRMEEELTLVDGNKAYFEVNIRPTAEGGLAILSIDVSERRRTEEAREALEEQLRQSQRMDAVGRLAGGIAHDFNNILSIILGYSETLLEDLNAQDPKYADVHEIHRAAERAAELTKQLLVFSRQQLVEPKVLDLNEVLGGMQKMLRRVLGEHIELGILLGGALGRIKADRGNIEQVIMNLVVNARDAMPKGGKLTVETGNIVLDESFARAHLGAEPGAYVLLAVTDTGLGMEKATRLRIFEPFFTTKEQGKGTGLGLSTVFGIVQQCRGGVWVYSEPGRGSTFKVYLPRTDAAAERIPASIATLNQRGTETVLLVEDDESVRNVAQRMLERNGYRVLVARDPSDALSISDEQGGQIAVLMTDVVMPRMSGATLAARLLARWPAMKALFVSGYTDGTVMAHGVLESGVPFLQKPFTSDQLARKLRSVLDTPAPADSANKQGASVA